MATDWSQLGKRQEEFAEALGLLLVFAKQQGIKVRVKDGYRDDRLHGRWGEKRGYGAAYSVHKLSLAVDLYTAKDKDHATLHDFWDTLGGARRIAGDMNHYSFEWDGHW